MTKLISFDIDGTLEVGDPPGCVTLEMVRTAKGRGHLIGSCSDRVISVQRRIWQEHNIAVDFTVLKYQLNEVRARFQVEEYYHIGDTEVDRFFAGRAGFRFILADDVVYHPWSTDGLL
ncbi:MAG: HAD family hydrolase [Dehalococcoidia bacterium]